MISFLAALGLLPLAFASTIPVLEPKSLSSNSYRTTCQNIAKLISSASGVFYPGSPSYVNDTHHYLPSSSQQSACSVEPGTAKDVSLILQVLSRTDTPFAIKSGGHGYSPGFSSTLGVQIAMTRLNSTTYDRRTNTVTLGPGQAWDQVYNALAPYEVGVLGGRIHGVGVAGYLLGGGYSWASNRYGLAIDSIVGYELVLPSGQIVSVTATSYPDLFFGLKGGYNNFGIVTKFVMTAFPQTKVWGGIINFATQYLEATIEAVADFSANNTDPDAEVIATYNWANGSTVLTLLTYYNAPTPKAGVFDKFLAIPAASKDIQTRTFPDFVLTVSALLLNSNNQRGGQNTLPLAEITPDFLRQVVNQTNYWGQKNIFTGIASGVEPFIPASITRPNESLTAYPHSKFTTPSALTWFWDDASKDDECTQALVETVQMLQGTVEATGQNLDGRMIYPNYAPAGQPLDTMYGDNLARLEKITAQYDPKGLMKRTGAPAKF